RNARRSEKVQRRTSKSDGRERGVCGLHFKQFAPLPRRSTWISNGSTSGVRSRMNQKPPNWNWDETSVPWHKLTKTEREKLVGRCARFRDTGRLSVAPHRRSSPIRARGFSPSKKRFKTTSSGTDPKGRPFRS